MDIFHLRWLLDENSSAAHPEKYRQNAAEQKYPATWLTPQGATDALAHFETFHNLLPGWLPTIIQRGAGAVVSQFNLSIAVVPDDHQHKHIIGKVADIALALIDSPKSQEALREMYLEITNNWNRMGVRGIPVPVGFNRNGVVDHFIRTLQNEFPVPAGSVAVEVDEGAGDKDVDDSKRI
ncbi:hypothetical protein GGI43DRAFT_407459 [Trichoderma evansii]